MASATPEHFDKTFNINARGAFFTVQKALPLMQKGGSIVLVSSGVHLKGVPQYTVYAATKAAMRSFARSWADELKDKGIRVNNLSPGATETGGKPQSNHGTTHDSSSPICRAETGSCCRVGR